MCEPVTVTVELRTLLAFENRCVSTPIVLSTMNETHVDGVRRYGIPDTEFSSDAIRGKCRDTTNHCFHTNNIQRKKLRHSSQSSRTTFIIARVSLFWLDWAVGCRRLKFAFTFETVIPHVFTRYEFISFISSLPIKRSRSTSRRKR